MKIESTVNLGTTVRLYLPRTERTEQPVDEAPPPQRPLPRQNPDHRRRSGRARLPFVNPWRRWD